MTEEEWFSTTDLWEMLKYVQPHCGERKMRLLAVACCHVLDDLFEDQLIRDALEAAELYADGHIEESILNEWSQKATEASEGLGLSLTAPKYMAYSLVGTTAQTGRYASDLGGVPGWVSQALACWAGHYWASPPWEEVQQQSARALRAFVIDVMDNPFWPAVLDSTWRTSDVLRLARQMYESRDFSAMPILGDALEEAGCDRADVLTHCRSAGPHIRGCWLVDLILDYR